MTITLTLWAWPVGIAALGLLMLFFGREQASFMGWPTTQLTPVGLLGALMLYTAAILALGGWVL